MVCTDITRLPFVLTWVPLTFKFTSRPLPPVLSCPAFVFEQGSECVDVLSPTFSLAQGLPVLHPALQSSRRHLAPAVPVVRRSLHTGRFKSSWRPKVQRKRRPATSAARPPCARRPSAHSRIASQPQHALACAPHAAAPGHGAPPWIIAVGGGVCSACTSAFSPACTSAGSGSR